MTNYRVRKLIVGIVAALAVLGTTVVTTAPAEATNYRTNYGKTNFTVNRVNGI